MRRPTPSIYSALGANLAIAIVKFIAGSASRSSSMISEAVHSMVDCLNELLLLLGIKKSNKKGDKEHPFGYGRELYFWSFIVAIMIFGLGAGVSFLQGFFQLREPELPRHIAWNYIVLACAFLFEGTSFLIALKAFNKVRRGDQSFWQAIRSSKDPTIFMILLEDAGAVAGVIVVVTFLFLGEKFQNPHLDGVASILVSLILAFISIILARECRSLLMGEGISKESEEKITDLVRQDRAVNNLHRIFSIYESPDEVLIVLIISFQEDLTVRQINQAIQRLKKTIRAEFGKINYIIIEPHPKEKKKADFKIGA
ncbi:MAG: cation transporter [Bacteroidetes bacterium]|nr:MAG: cation transporter [Bacteroidota bacterium]